ncbi:hypothetical protein [Aquimarina megaterium]|uniref:hypothetical protein n=1 Tax=Aquimarina megaterium TaxID=1443666 RepID=UPI000472349D|nr:hypothetical protein [Aquimarina megaterium]
MNKLILLFTFLIIFSSCTKDVSDVYTENKTEFNNIASIIKSNSEYFQNEVNRPTIFYTFVFTQNYEDFLKRNLKNKRLSEDDFIKLRELFKKLSIKEFYLLDSKNFIFKINQDDFILRKNMYYLGYLDNNTLFINHKSFDGLYLEEHEKISNNWHSLVYMSSPAD